MDVLRRHLVPRAQRLLASFPVVAIVGPRQCGKTTLAHRLAPDWRYFDLENPSDSARVVDDPVLFFAEHPRAVILDEAQRSPAVFETLRGVIDAERGTKGRFIVTGSGSFELTRQLNETLAGRIAVVELAPMSMTEKEAHAPSGFFQLFERPLEKAALTWLLELKPMRSTQGLRSHLLRGGYPEPSLSDDPTFHLDWMENYVRTYVERDVRQMFPGLDLIKYRRVLSMLSQLSGTVINRSDIARSVEVSEKTVRDYLDIIGGTFFWRSLEAYPKSKIKTSLKLPKGHFADSGVGLFLQNVHTERQLDTFPALGRYFEAFVIEEILRNLMAVGVRNLSAYHFRTKAGAEVDLILEGAFGTLPVEVKHASHVRPAQVTSLVRFIEAHDLPLGVVVSRCARPSLITQSVIEIPVSCL
jgi:predicted AAA+ superfamily ATPase